LRRSGRNKDKEVYDSHIAKMVASASKDSRSGRRPRKEVVVEPDNNEKYVDVNDELSDDDFVNSSYVSVLRRSGRNKDQELYDSDHVKTVASGSKGKGKIQRRKRSRETSMPKAEKKTASGKIAGLKPNQKACLEEVGFGGMVEFKVDRIPSKLGLNVVDNFDEKKMEIKLSKGSIVLKKDMIGDMLDTNLSNINWCDYVWRVLKTCKKGWKKGKKDSYFRGPLTVLTVFLMNLKQMCYVDDTNCNDNIVCRRRPPTKVWTVELLSEREAVELNYGGFGHGELEEDFINEEGDPIPTILRNINLIGFADKYMNSLKCSSGGNNSGTNATMPDTQEKEKDVQGEAGYPNMNRVEALNEEVEVRNGDIGVNEQTPCSDEVELSIEKSKSMEIYDRPSFSFGVTQDFDVIPVTKNENKVLTPMPISVYTPGVEASDVFMFHGKRVTTKSNIMRSPFYSRVADDDAALSSEESKYRYFVQVVIYQQSNRLQMESLGQDYVETNILDTWAVVRNFMEEYRSNDSPFRLFLPTFVVDKDSFSQMRNDNGRFERVLQHVESVTKRTSELNKLKKIDLVFLPVDNEGHRFLLTFNLKYGDVTVFDQKKKDKLLKKSKLKKGAKIGNSIVAEMLIRTSEGAHGARFQKYVIRFAIGKRTCQDKMNGTLM
nr:hypothetical protein [Tanacetum cinerariifolium]